MNPLDTQQLITDESAAARQLRRGFKWLRFEFDLEREFRRDHARSRLPQIRINLYIAAVLVLVFGALHSLVLGPGSHSALYVVQFGLLLPCVAATIVIAHLPNARKVYPRVAPMLAPIMGLLVIAVELKAAQAGVQIVFATVLLTSVYMYFLIGLLFYEALTANLIVWAAYVAFGIVAGAPRNAHHLQARSCCCWRTWSARAPRTASKRRSARTSSSSACWPRWRRATA